MEMHLVENWLVSNAAVQIKLFMHGLSTRKCMLPNCKYRGRDPNGHLQIYRLLFWLKWTQMNERKGIGAKSILWRNRMSELTTDWYE